jgi:hypothetical protein
MPHTDGRYIFDLTVSSSDTGMNICEHTPQGTTTNTAWANVLHLTATGNDCCNYGDRIPGIWFYPNTMRFHLTDGSLTDGGSNECGVPSDACLTV